MAAYRTASISPVVRACGDGTAPGSIQRLAGPLGAENKAVFRQKNSHVWSMRRSVLPSDSELLHLTLAEEPSIFLTEEAPISVHLCKIYIFRYRKNISSVILLIELNYLDNRDRSGAFSVSGKACARDALGGAIVLCAAKIPSIHGCWEGSAHVRQFVISASRIDDAICVTTHYGS